MLKKLALVAVVALGSSAAFADKMLVVVLVHKFGQANPVKYLKFLLQRPMVYLQTNYSVSLLVHSAVVVQVR